MMHCLNLIVPLFWQTSPFLPPIPSLKQQFGASRVNALLFLLCQVTDYVSNPFPGNDPIGAHGPYLSYLSSLGVFQMPRKGPDQSKSSALGYEDSSCSSAIPHLTGAALSEGHINQSLSWLNLRCIVHKLMWTLSLL